MLRLDKGHCRRRKIRCVPSQNDVQGRCINCIRLKKECSFYPVDQQPPLDTRQKSASRSSVGPKIASASSSPPMQTRIPADIHGQQPYPQLSVPAIQSMAPPMKPPGSENYPPDPRSKSVLLPQRKELLSKHPQVSSSATGTRPYEYGHQEMTNWMSADASPSSSKPSDLNATWRSYPADSPLTPAFSPYTPHAPTVSATWSASEPSRDGVAWSSYPAPPSRSLPFGTEGMTSHQQYPSISQVSNHSSRAYVRKSSSSSEMYAPAIATTTPGIETVPGNTMDPNASLSAGTVPPSSYAPWQQSYPYSKPAESYGGWYGDAGTHQPLGPGAQHPSGHAHSGSGVYYGR